MGRRRELFPLCSRLTGLLLPLYCRRAVNARAVWEATRDPEKKAAEQSSRKSQVGVPAAWNQPKRTTHHRLHGV